MTRFTDLPEAIRSKIEPLPDAPGCWLWSGKLNHSGYGTVGHAGKSWLAHRLTYTLLVAPPPADKRTLDHVCRVRCCVNPAHLRPATDRENVLAPGSLASAKRYAERTHCDKHGTPLEWVKSGKRRRRCRRCSIESTLRNYRANKERWLSNQRAYLARKRAEASA